MDSPFCICVVERISQIFVGKNLPKTIQLTFHSKPAFCNPIGNNIQSSWIGVAGADSPSLFALHEVALFQNLDVLNNGGKCEAEGLGDLRKCRRPPRKAFNYGHPDWLRKSSKTFPW
jgi:hypothetical protein